MRPAELARRTACPPSTLHGYLTDREMPATFLVATCRALDLSAHWLLLGEGPMHAGQVDLGAASYEAIAAEFLARLGQMHAAMAALRPAMERLAAGEAVPAAKAAAPRAAHRRPGFREVGPEDVPTGHDWQDTFLPVIAMAAAGAGASADQADAYPPGWAESFVEFHGAPAGSFAVRVSGDSMVPAYHDGDLLVIDPARQARNGEIAVVVYRDPDLDVRAARLKRHRRRGATVILESLAAGHPPVRLPADRVIAAYAIHQHLAKWTD